MVKLVDHGQGDLPGILEPMQLGTAFGVIYVAPLESPLHQGAEGSLCGVVPDEPTGLGGSGEQARAYLMKVLRMIEPLQGDSADGQGRTGHGTDLHGAVRRDD